MSEFEFSSFVRAIRGSRTKKCLKCFELLARDTHHQSDCLRQDLIDELWLLAKVAGLVQKVGADAVQAALSNAFVRSAQ